MKKRTWAMSVLGIILSLVLSLAVNAQELRPSSVQDLPFTHTLYDPFNDVDEMSRFLPEKAAQFSKLRTFSLLAKPDGIDLDVAYISRTPMYNRYEVWYTSDGTPYLRPGTEDYQRWPTPGELVTFTVHIVNKGTVESGSFAFAWYIDGVEVATGTHSSLAPDAEGTETYQWSWAHTLSGEKLLGSHTVRFKADPTNTILETYESNNVIEDRTDALSLALVLTPEVYTALETPADEQWPFSAEDWLQKQVAAMNAAFQRSVFPSAPGGIQERVRIDTIYKASSPPPEDFVRDGAWYIADDLRIIDAYYDATSDISGSLLHELTHQLGIIDMYRLDAPLEVTELLDRVGQPVQIEFLSYFLFPGLMNSPGIQPPIYDEHTALALNANKGYRRGYYGEYLYDVPQQTFLRILDNTGNPSPGVTVKLFQRASGSGQYGSQNGIIDDTPEMMGVTDASGLVLLDNRPISSPVSTHTGHILDDNPFGTISVVGTNDEFIVELTKDFHQEYHWLDITRFNLAFWSGNIVTATFDFSSQVPTDNAPMPPSNLTGLIEFGSVKLEWSPSPSTGIAGYNLYQARNPNYAYQRILTGATGLSFTENYNFEARSVNYAVTAVDTQGRESGFSNVFSALRVINPASIVVDEQNRHIVLDPQNGYALLYQSSDGRFIDTRGSQDFHLEYSNYLERDVQGRLIISHPGDYYITRHSVRVTGPSFIPILEFGNTGSNLGQFQTPTGVKVWCQPCIANLCRFIVADSGNNRIQAFDLSGNFISAYGSSGSANGRFNNPQGLAIDSMGNIIVVDKGNNRLQILSFNGMNFGFIRTITANFDQPTGITLYKTLRIIVADTGNNKVKILDVRGNLLSQYTAPNDGRIGSFSQPHGVAVDHNGRIWVADTGNKRVVTILNALPIWELYLPIAARGP